VTDEAIERHDWLEAFLSQRTTDFVDARETADLVSQFAPT